MDVQRHRLNTLHGEIAFPTRPTRTQRCRSSALKSSSLAPADPWSPKTLASTLGTSDDGLRITDHMPSAVHKHVREVPRARTNDARRRVFAFPMNIRRSDEHILVLRANKFKLRE